ncbi:hypothetical protein [Calothrix sp. UHCC 0171]|nr:hypothetical protein [Calothrix sp. UHCC 0171]MEA5572977.1 hypothetical protein [Calothrix sp. UHCC 0171]
MAFVKNESDRPYQPHYQKCVGEFFVDIAHINCIIKGDRSIPLLAGMTN